ncbi:MAG: hypothetical protein AB7F32_11845, partial [Victivallaceae bacterium]
EGALPNSAANRQGAMSQKHHNYFILSPKGRNRIKKAAATSQPWRGGMAKTVTTAKLFSNNKA